jgi:hypothetical protein
VSAGRRCFVWSRKRDEARDKQRDFRNGQLRQVRPFEKVPR